MSVHEIRVYENNEDPHARAVTHDAATMLDIDNVHLMTTTVYRVEDVTDEEAVQLANEVLHDPVSQGVAIGPRTDWDDERIVEVAYKPGVMNPVSESFMRAATMLGIPPAAVDSSVEYRFGNDVGTADVASITSGILVNKTVQLVRHEAPETLGIIGTVGPVETVPIRAATDDQLMELSKGKLFLNLEEMKVVQDYYKDIDREPTDCELEIIAARWSEHCGHKTFNAELIIGDERKKPLFTRIKDEAKKHFYDTVLSAFHDNSGVIKFYDDMAVCGKVETHNSPSALEPYGGAMTGSGGVFRDIMGTGKGADVILSTDMFCFAPTGYDKTRLPAGVLPPDYLQRRVVDGVRDYGNRMGIPTANGSIHYHDGFRAKPSVIVGAYGLMPEEYVAKGKPVIGDYVVAIGGRTGRDGIHGATFSSGSMTAETASINSSAVQIGNAIEEKRMLDALLEARDLGLIRALTDCGAAGFSSAIGEMGEDIGVTVDLAQAPLKYEGLAPWEIWLSESQERMVAAVDPEQIEAFEDVCRKHDVEMAVLGYFDGSERLQVRYEDTVVADLDFDFLKNGLPQREMVARWEAPTVPERLPVITNLQETLEAVLSHGNVCSKEPVVRQYDHQVRGGTVVPPFGGQTYAGPNDAVVLAPLPHQKYGFVQSHGMNPALMELDPYNGSVWAFAEALSNYVAAGGDPDNVAAINNFIWPSPTERVMGSLDKSVDAIVDCMRVLDIPVISGKDSLSSTYKNGHEVIEIPPVLTISLFGGIEDVTKTMTTNFKQPGSQVIVLGQTDYDKMGGSTLYDVAGGSSATVPEVKLRTLAGLSKTLHAAIKDGQVLACHDISEGGTIVAVAEMAFGSPYGVAMSVPEDYESTGFLFNETAGRFIVELPAEVDPHAVFNGWHYERVGTVTGLPSFHVEQAGETLIETTVADLKAAWQRPLREFYDE